MDQTVVVKLFLRIKVQLVGAMVTLFYLPSRLDYFFNHFLIELVLRTFLKVVHLELLKQDEIIRNVQNRTILDFNV